MELDTALAVARESDGDVPQMELVALAPSDLLAAQTNLVNWCDAKTRSLHTEIADLRENLRIAKESKWRTAGLQSALNRAKRRVMFYDKIKAAVAAGYLIVPNFPVDVFAVRVSRDAPKGLSRTSTWGRGLQASAEQLPVGDGRYVSNAVSETDRSYTEQTPDGKKKEITYITGDEYVEEIGFPVQAVRPVVMDATQRAMALRIFDQIGLVANGGREYVQQRGDPIVVGRLIDPRGNGRMVTFFVAWWLNTRDL